MLDQKASMFPVGHPKLLCAMRFFIFHFHMNFLGELKHSCRHDAQNDSEVRKITHNFSIKKKLISQQPFIRFFPS